ncbi:hypothetical protein, partial [Cronobacter sakazakii]|uniref:hypothetical protein n=1 Tax=Cronobacter sakazakii TaxID=28141 RepID=UPI001F425CCD
IGSGRGTGGEGGNAGHCPWCVAQSLPVLPTQAAHAVLVLHAERQVPPALSAAVTAATLLAPSQAPLALAQVTCPCPRDGLSAVSRCVQLSSACARRKRLPAAHTALAAAAARSCSRAWAPRNRGGRS